MGPCLFRQLQRFIDVRYCHVHHSCSYNPQSEDEHKTEDPFVAYFVPWCTGHHVRETTQLFETATDPNLF